MKKIIIFLILIGVMFIVGCNNQKNTTDNIDALQFKKEYEALNGLDIENSNGKRYTTITIAEETPFIYADYEDVFRVLDETGIVYFGFPECPWCRNVVPILIEAAEEYGVDTIYYMNNLNDRDIQTLDDDGKVVVDKKGSDKYYELLDRIGKEFTSEYNGLNDASIRRLYFPTVIFIKDGKVIYSHVSTVESQNDPYTPMTTEQKEELKDIYLKYMEKVDGELCNIEDPC